MFTTYCAHVIGNGSANVLTLCGATHRLEVGSGSGPVHTWNNNKNTTMQFFSGALSFPRRSAQAALPRRGLDCVRTVRPRAACAPDVG